MVYTEEELYNFWNETGVLPSDYETPNTITTGINTSIDNAVEYIKDIPNKIFSVTSNLKWYLIAIIIILILALWGYKYFLGSK